jgi:hypothetical protein
VATKPIEHAAFNDGWIEIFRAGNYGDKGIFSATDLDRVISNYDPDHHEAPACIGHPKDNLPAYGWTSQLKRDGDTLLAKFKEVDPDFESLVKAGRFKKRSAAFYLDGAGKVAGLRHVAFLGAQPPEVKGLKNLNFEDNGRSFISVNFGEEEAVEVTEKTIREQISAFFSEVFGKKSGESATTFSEADVKRIAAEAVTAATKPLQDKITQLETDQKAQNTKFSEREQQLAQAAISQRAVEAINGLKGKGKWIPAFEKAGLPLLFDEISKISTTVEFGEAGADGKKPQVAPVQLLVSFMEGLPQIVPGGRLVDPASAAASGAGKKSTDPLTVAAKARQKEKSITFGEALRQIAEEHPELTAVTPAGSV